MRILKSIRAGFALLLVMLPTECLAQISPTSPSSAGVSPTRSPVPPSSATVRFIAIDRNGQPVTDLKPEDLRLFVNKQERRILSVSSTGPSPKTIGIFIAGYRPDPLSNKAIAAIQGILNSVWQEQDVAFVVSFSDKIYQDVPPTSDVTRIDDFLSKILKLNLDRESYLLSHWTTKMPPAWDEAVSSAPQYPQEAGSAEKVYIILSGFYLYDSVKSRINAVLKQQVRFFPVLVDSNPEGGGDCPSDSDAQGPCYLGFWKEEHNAKSIAKKSGGDEFTALTRKDLARAQARLTNELRSTYVVTYEPLPIAVPAGKIKILCRVRNVRLLYPRE